MNKITSIYEMLNGVKTRIIKQSHNNISILDECALINMKRIFYLSFIIIPLRIMNILLFVSATTPLSIIWQRGIIASHVSILIFWIGLLFIVYPLKNKAQSNAIMHSLEYIAPISIMISGIIIVAIDQLVTTNITPFLLVSIVVGMVFLIRPIVSALIYFSSYILYYYSISLTITDKQLLLSNRANGLTVVGIGFLMSVIIWHYNYINMTQKHRIKEQQKQLEEMAYYDQLTNLHNRHFFLKVVQNESSLMKRYGNESVIIIFDIDNFKNINDTYGHLVGDQVLKQLAELITSNTRESDTIARYGGEEFIILAPQTNLEEGAVLANKLKDIIANHSFIINHHLIHITASFGVSPAQLDEGQGFESFLSLADYALYMAKIRGKNRVIKIQADDIGGTN